MDSDCRGNVHCAFFVINTSINSDEYKFCKLDSVSYVGIVEL